MVVTAATVLEVAVRVAVDNTEGMHRRENVPVPLDACEGGHSVTQIPLKR